MQFIVLVEENIDGYYTATWTSMQGHFTDKTTGVGINPYEALTNLVSNLHARENRQEVIRAIDSGDD